MEPDGGEDAQRVVAELPRFSELADLDFQPAKIHVGERNALGVVDFHAQCACRLEFLDRFRELAHLLEDRAAHVSRDRQAQRGVMRLVPIDDLRIQRQRLFVIVHVAHDLRQRVRGNLALYRSVETHAGLIGLHQVDDREVSAILPVLQDAQRDAEARFGDGVGRELRTRGFDGADRRPRCPRGRRRSQQERKGAGAESDGSDPERVRAPPLPLRVRRCRVPGSNSFRPGSPAGRQSGKDPDAVRSARSSVRLNVGCSVALASFATLACICRMSGSALTKHVTWACAEPRNPASTSTAAKRFPVLDLSRGIWHEHNRDRSGQTDAVSRFQKCARGEKCASGSGLILIDEGHPKAGASPEMSKIPNPVRLLFEYPITGAFP